MVIKSKINEPVWRHHIAILSLREIFRCSRAANSVVSGPIWPKLNLCKTLCISLLPVSIQRIGSKANEKKWRHLFPNYNPMGVFCCHGHQNSDPVCLKTCSLYPPQIMLHIKFDGDWPIHPKNTQVWKCKIFIIQEQVTSKWVVWSGPKSNSFELLCLSWLPAALVMVQSKINELAWWHHFPIISFFRNFLDAFVWFCLIWA